MELQWAIPGRNKIEGNLKNPSLLFDKFLSVKNFASDMEKGKNIESLTNLLQPGDEYVKAYQQKMENLEMGLHTSGYLVGKYIYKSISPFIIGMGRPSALENGLTFNRNWGLPTIPSSAIKGVVRSYIEFYGIDEERKKVQKYLGSDDDNNPESGKVNFLNAYMLESSRVYRLDIINNHFPDYYQKENVPPNDWFNPNPVTFLDLRINIKFVFPILGRNEEIIQEVSSWLERALLGSGIGAKTAVGYGRFVLDKSASNESNSKIKKQQEEQAKSAILEKMTPLERTFYEIETAPADKKFEKSIAMFNKLDSIEDEQEKIEYAKELKKIWMEIGKWNKKDQSKKQVKKSEKLKKILKEN